MIGHTNPNCRNMKKNGGVILRMDYRGPSILCPICIDEETARYIKHYNREIIKRNRYGGNDTTRLYYDDYECSEVYSQ